MKEENIQNNIEKDVLKKIEVGNVKMKPKSYFLLKRVLLVFVTATTFISTTLLVSFLIFSLKNRGDLFLLGFGSHGIYRFILVFPWYLLLANAFLLIFLDYLLRRFKYGYNSPLVYLFLATLLSVTLFSFVVNYTSFHSRFSKFAEKNKIPLADDLYKDIKISHKEKGVYRGVVSFIGPNYLVLKPSSDAMGAREEIMVYAPAGVDLKDFVEVGEEVYIASYMSVATGTRVASFGIRKITQ